MVSIKNEINCLVSVLVLMLYSTPCFAQWGHYLNSGLYGILPYSISDGKGGAYFAALEDWDAGGCYTVIRYDKYGYSHYNDTGFSPLYDVRPFPETMVTDSCAGLMIVVDVPDSGLHIQKIDSTGTKLWGENGIEIKVDSFHTSYIYTCSDDMEGMYLFIIDNENCLWMSHLDADGNHIGNEKELMLSGVAHYGFRLFKGPAGAYIFYYNYDDTRRENLIVNLVGENDLFKWGNGITAGLPTDTDISGIHVDSTGIVTSSITRPIAIEKQNEQDVPNENRTKLFAQFIDLEGSHRWDFEGILLADYPLGHIRKAEIINSGQYDYMIIWDSNHEGKNIVYAQKVNAQGIVLWDSEKKIISHEGSGDYLAGQNAVVKSDGDNILVCASNESNNAIPYDSLFVHKIDSSGNIIWYKDVNYISYSLNYSANLVSDGNGGGIVTWGGSAVISGSWINQVSKNGNLGEVVVSVSNPEPTVFPSGYSLAQNYPNPFNPDTRIDFTLLKPTFVTLEIFNTLGQKVTTLKSGQMAPGNHEVTWNGRNSAGIPVSAGLYFYRLKTAEHTLARKMILLK